MTEITEAVKAEIRRILPDDINVGDTFPLSTGNHIRVTEILDSNRFNYTLVDGPIKAKKVEKKVETQKLPSNTITTSNINLSTSGTSGADITVSNNPDIKVNVNIETKKGKIKDHDPYNWYIKKRLKY